MARVKVSSRYQISVPSAVRKKLCINAGDHLRVDVRDGDIVLTPEPASYSRRFLGLHREVWEGIDTDEYLRQEREAWQRP